MRHLQSVDNYTFGHHFAYTPWQAVKVLLKVWGWNILLQGALSGCRFFYHQFYPSAALIDVGLDQWPYDRGLYVLAFLIVLQREKRRNHLEQLVLWKMSGWLWLLLLPALLAALGGIILGQELFNLTHAWNSQFGTSLQAVPDGEAVLQGLWSVFISSSIEEMFFRGLLLRGLCAKAGPAVALFVSSVLFGIAHLNVPQAAFAFGIGLILGAVYLMTRSVMLCVLMHAFINCVASFGHYFLPAAFTSEFYAAPQLSPVYFQAGWFDFAGGLMCVVGLVLCGVLSRPLRQHCVSRQDPT